VATATTTATTTVEPALPALLIEIAAINTWNRLNVTTRQVAGSWPTGAERST
jgi:hypothetical protein